MPATYLLKEKETFTREEIEAVKSAGSSVADITEQQLESIKTYFSDYVTRNEKSNDPEKQRKVAAARKLASAFSLGGDLAEYIQSIKDVSIIAKNGLDRNPDKQIFNGTGEELTTINSDMTEQMRLMPTRFKLAFAGEGIENQDVNMLQNTLKEFVEADDFAEYEKDEASNDTTVPSLLALQILEKSRDAYDAVDGVVQSQQHRLFHQVNIVEKEKRFEEDFLKEHGEGVLLHLDGDVTISKIENKLDYAHQDYRVANEEYTDAFDAVYRAEDELENAKKELSEATKQSERIKREIRLMKDKYNSLSKKKSTDINTVDNSVKKISDLFTRMQKSKSSPGKVAADSTADSDNARREYLQLANELDIKTVINSVLPLNATKEQKDEMMSYVYAKKDQHVWNAVSQAYESYMAVAGKDPDGINYLFTKNKKDADTIFEQMKSRDPERAEYAKQMKERLVKITPYDVFNEHQSDDYKKTFGEFIKGRLDSAQSDLDNNAAKTNMYMNQLAQINEKIDREMLKNKKDWNERKIYIDTINSLEQKMDELRKDKSEAGKLQFEMIKAEKERMEKFSSGNEKQEELVQRLTDLQTEKAKILRHLVNRGIYSEDHAKRIDKLAKDLADEGSGKINTAFRRANETKVKAEKAQKALDDYKKLIDVLDAQPDFANDKDWKNFKNQILSDKPDLSGFNEEFKKHLDDLNKKAAQRINNAGQKEIEEYIKANEKPANDRIERANKAIEDAKAKIEQAKIAVAEKKLIVEQKQKEIANLQTKKERLNALHVNYKTLKHIDNLLYVNTYDSVKKDFDAGERIYDRLFKKIEEFKQDYTKAQKESYNNDPEKNSDKYKAIKAALDAFGSKEDMKKLTVDQLHEKLTNLQTASEEYKRAKMGQMLHLMPSKQRKYRLRYSDQITAFAKGEAESVFKEGQKPFWTTNEDKMNDISSAYATAQKPAAQYNTALCDEKIEKIYAGVKERMEEKVNALKNSCKQKMQEQADILKKPANELTQEQTDKAILGISYYCGVMKRIENPAEKDNMEDFERNVGSLLTDESRNSYVDAAYDKEGVRQWADGFSKTYAEKLKNMSGQEIHKLISIDDALKLDIPAEIEAKKPDVLRRRKEKPEVVKAEGELQNVLNTQKLKNKETQKVKKPAKPVLNI